MEHAPIEALLGREMPHTGHKRPPPRLILRPLGKDVVDGRVVESRCPPGVGRYGQALPLPARVEPPEEKVKDAVRAQCALWPALGHREVRQDMYLSKSNFIFPVLLPQAARRGL